MLRNISFGYAIAWENRVMASIKKRRIPSAFCRLGLLYLFLNFPNIKHIASLYNRKPPKWRRGLRHCIAVLEASLQTRVQSRAVSQPSIVRGGFGRLGYKCPITLLQILVAGRAHARWLRSPVVRCFLWHFGAAGFRFKWAVCQEAVLLGKVMFRRAHGSRPSPLPNPYGSCSDGTLRKRGLKCTQKMCIAYLAGMKMNHGKSVLHLLFNFLWLQGSLEARKFGEEVPRVNGLLLSLSCQYMHIIISIG